MGTILKLIFSVGIILVILGLILNPLFIEKFVSPDQRLDNPSKISSIIFFELVLILVGCTIILLRYRILKLVKRYNYKLLYIILVLVILLIIVEIVIRMLIKNPVIELPYFNIYYDYWLIKKPQDSNITTPYTTHPSLGWDFKQNFSSNCHNTDIYGAKISKTGYDDSKQNILFFGDSFTESRTCSNNSLPAKLEKELEIDTLNFGLSGYSMDQLLFKLNHSLKNFDEPIILIGLVDVMVDRTTMFFHITSRDYYSVTDDGKLVLVTANLDKKGVKSRKPKYNSYLVDRLYYSEPGYILFHYQRNKDRQNMKLVTAGILKEFSNLRTTSDLEIIFVLFYSEPKVWVDDWRHEFLREELTKLNFTYLDTRDYFNAYIEKNKGDFSQFYIPSDGHYNDLANTIVAKGLANDISQAMD